MEVEKIFERLQLSKKARDVLRKHGLTSKKKLAMLSDRDVHELGLTKTQSGRLMDVIEGLRHQFPPEEEETGDDSDDAGDIIATASAGSGQFVQALLNKPPGDEVPTFNPVFGLDPRATLTVKAKRTKTVHITEFVPETVKRKRGPKTFRVENCETEAHFVYQEPPVSYDGISVDVWGAANMRLLNHLLQSGRLARNDIEFYLAYTAHVFDLADRYTWSSVLAFDMQYRELQAEHAFPWGTFAAQLEMKTLVPKGPLLHIETRHGEEECKLFKAQGWCKYGAGCKFKHVPARAGREAISARPTTSSAEQTANGGTSSAKNAA